MIFDIAPIDTAEYKLQTQRQRSVVNQIWQYAVFRLLVEGKGYLTHREFRVIGVIAGQQQEGRTFDNRFSQHLGELERAADTLTIDEIFDTDLIKGATNTIGHSHIFTRVTYKNIVFHIIF